VEDEAEKYEDDAARLSDLIALAEAVLKAEKEDDDIGRLSELIALAEAGFQVEEDEDAFFTQAAAATDEAEATYYRRQAEQGHVGEPSHMTETEEDVLFSQATDDTEVAYYSQ
jgi:hypothetical protein